MSASTWWCIDARPEPGVRWRTSSTAIRPRPSPPTLLHEGDGAHGGAVAACEAEGRRDEAAAGRLDLIEVGQVLDHRDAGREEHVVGRAVVPRDFFPGVKGHGANRGVGGVVVPHALDPALPQPLTGAPPGEGCLAPEALAPHRALEGPVRAQAHDIAALDVTAS